jgi:type I restriction enzyme M protein
MVDLLFAEDNDALLEPGVVRSVYDPTAGTGGMLSVAEEHLLAENPDARLRLYGQELNDQSYAICNSDMIAKGQDASNIRLGDTLADDQFAGKTFDYCLSNPPYGVDWRASEDAVKAERARTGPAGGFAAGLPKIGDGQMLFLLHLASKMRPAREGGGRAGIVLNGSPLFNGAAESGESEIRRWLLEHDLVDAIVALPTGMFYNTGIATYIWVLDNTKPPERAGKVQLIDASQFFTKMRRNLGARSREVSPADRDRIVRIYDAYDDQAEQDAGHSRVFSATDFGYYTITVERPLRLNFACTPDRIDALLDTAAGKGPLKSVDPTALRAALESFGGAVHTNREQFLAALKPHLQAAGLTLGAPAWKAIWSGLSQRDDTTDICTDRKGNPEPDVSLRDTENVPFNWAPPGQDGGVRPRPCHVADCLEVEVDGPRQVRGRDARRPGGGAGPRGAATTPQLGGANSPGLSVL